MFDWFKANTAMAIIVFGGLFVIGIVTVVAIVLRGGWKDRGFMIRDGHPLHLPASLPWTITVEPNVPTIYVDALNTVVLQLREKVGNIFDHVVQLQSGEVALDIKVLVAIDKDIDHPGETIHQFNKETGVIMSAFVSMWPDLSYADALKVATHEIGHVVGLDHDEHVSSIMHHMIQNRPQTFTDKDYERLRKAYT